ncbi:MAG: PTS sugar transporter subunit IIA [Candidatus Hydrogenedentes bacterium]|nr:PTS sugar transporter subunit IIA [Candidatus Hydrogenedentota bacterium]
MTLFEALRKECTLVGVTPDTKAAALAEVARCAKRSPLLDHVPEDAIVQGLEEREALGSTGFGNGIAIPHCRLEEVKDFIVGILTVPEGVEFDSLDKKPVRLMVFIIAPKEASNEHIRLLSAISQALSGPDAIKEIVAEKTPEAVFEGFLRHASGELKREGHTGKNVIHIFVQDEAVFHDLIQIFAGMEASDVAIITSENLSAYFSKVPLFRGLWDHEPGGFSHLILALVPRELTNETVRQIEAVTGNLDNRTGVMVTIQELFYSAGSLKN